MMIGAGYEDGIDANSLRSDPMFKMALDLTPSDRELCSQSTISRLENLPDVRALLRMGRAMVDLYCESFAQVPKRITLDIDDTFDAVHGGQQLSLFNAHYDEYGFQPIVVFDGEGRFITAMLRPAKRPSGKEIKPFLRRLLRAYPRPLAANGNLAARRQPLLRARGSRLLSRQRPRLHPRRRADLDVAPACRGSRSPRRRRGSKPRLGDGKLRRFKEFYDGAQSWSRVERIIARVEVGAEGPDTRFVVTNLKKRNARALYEDLYCRRGQAENHIKSFKTHLAADRTSCTKATANPVPPLPPRRRLLVDVGPSRLDAETLDVARRSVRHAAPASHQDRRPRRRDEDDDPRASADIVSRPGHLALRPATHTAPRHLSDGA